MPPRRVVFVIFGGFQALDLAGPHDVFQEAGSLSGGYRCQIVASCPGTVRSASGLQVHAEHGVADLDPAGMPTSRPAEAGRLRLFWLPPPRPWPARGWAPGA